MKRRDASGAIAVDPKRSAGFDSTIDASGLSSQEGVVFPGRDAHGLARVERDRYVVSGELAQGGIGRIIHARDARLKRPVALKELLDPSPEAESRFLREALVTARLQHPSIVPVYDAGRWPSGEAFYAMKLVSGRSLAEVVESTKSFEERLALVPHVLAVAEAMAYAHSEGIIHRDLKPGNVLVGSFGETLVIDWGIAKDLRENAGPDPSNGAADGSPSPSQPMPDDAVSSADALTMQGAIMGTPAYMPPEQAAGEHVDERADVYALGAILYHVLAGAPPYEGKNALDIVKQVLEVPPASLSERQPGVPVDLSAIVEKAMARASSDRYPTAKELAEDLRLFQTGQIVRAHHYSPSERVVRFVRKYRTAVSVAGFALVVVAAVATMSILRVFAARRAAEAERDRASEERARAERKQAEAEEAKMVALEHADDLTLVEARTAAARDPNEAIRWLSSLSSGFSRIAEARLVAADAEARGLARVLRGHTGAINYTEYSPDGKIIVTSSDDKTIRVWDQEGKPLRVLEGHTDEVWNMMFSPDGKRLASTSKDGSLRLWDVGAWTSRVLLEKKPPTTAPKFISDGKRVVAASCGVGSIVLWDPERDERTEWPADVRHPSNLDTTRDGKLVVYSYRHRLRVVEAETGKARDIGDESAGCLYAFVAPDGSHAVCMGAYGRVSLFHVATGRQLDLPGLTLGPREKSFIAAMFSGDSKRVAWGGFDGVLHVMRLSDGRKEVFEAHKGAIFTINFSPDSRFIGTASSDHTLGLWDLVEHKHRKFGGFHDQVSWVSFSPVQNTIVVSSWDHTARIFPLENRRNRIVIEGASPMTQVSFSPDGASLAAIEQRGIARGVAFERKKGPEDLTIGGDVHAISSDGASFASAKKNGLVQVWKPGAAEPLTLRGHEGPVATLVFSPRGDRLASAGIDGTVRIWDLAAGRGRALPLQSSAGAQIAFSPDGAKIGVGAGDGVVRVFSDDRAEPLVLRGHAGAVLALLFLPDGNRIASGSSDHTLRIWDMRTGQSRTIEASGLGITRILVSADGSTLFTLGGETAIRRWDVETGRALPILLGHESVAVEIAISPDGGRLVSGGEDGAMRLWDLASGEGRALVGHKGNINALAFSPKGDRIASASADGTVRVWQDDLPRDAAGFREWLEGARAAYGASK